MEFIDWSLSSPINFIIGAIMVLFGFGVAQFLLSLLVGIVLFIIGYICEIYRKWD